MGKRSVVAWGALACLIAGCSNSGEHEFVPVSGRVTVDGKPLANVRVMFRPVTGANPGPSSVGDTDADGRFKLVVSSQKYSGNGAVAGRHSVSIGTILAGEGGKPTDASIGSADGEPLPGRELIPPQYNQNTTLEFDVPKKGTDQANFELKLK